MKLFRRELKVCEACGGLWVRTGAEAGVYCRECRPLVAAMPERRRRKPGRPCSVHGKSTAEALPTAAVARLQVVRAEGAEAAGGVR